MKRLALVSAVVLFVSATWASAQVNVRLPFGGISIGAPPPPQVEVVTAPPHPGYAWIGGHWVYSNRANKWEWMPGHWVAKAAPMPPPPPPDVITPQPGPRYHWIPGHWRYGNRGWVWVAAHWDKQ